MTGPALAGGFGAGGAIERAAGSAGVGGFAAEGPPGVGPAAGGFAGAAGAAGFGAGGAGFAAGGFETARAAACARRSSMSRIDVAPARAGGGGDIGIGIPSS